MISHIMCSIELSLMHVRIRTRSTPGSTGNRVVKRTNVTPVQIIQSNSRDTYPLMEQEFEDVVGNYPYDNPAKSVLYKRSGGLANGSQARSGYEVTYSNWLLDSFVGTIVSHPTPVDEPSDSWVATEIAASTNPSKPTIPLPLALYELRELPDQLRIRMGTQIRKRRRGDSTLEFNFGWAPIIQDLQKMARLVHSVDSRLETLRILAKNGKNGLSRGRTVWSGSVIQTDNTKTLVDYTSRGAIWRQTQSVNSRSSKRATIRWALNGDVANWSDHEKWKLMMRISLGLEVGQLPEQIYDAMPWTWLAGWFVNLGDFLGANNNTLASPVSPPLISTVRETTVTVSGFSHDRPGNVSVGDYVVYRRDWFRRPVPILAQFRMPILTFGQVATLASLANR